jgi:hypothetical protein
MTFLHARLGYLTCDQEALAPIVDRAITACVIGVVAKQGSAEDAVAAVLDWLAYGEQSGRIEIDFPRTHELLAACVVEAFRRYLRHNNSAIFDIARLTPPSRLGRVATGKNSSTAQIASCGSGAGK